MTSRPLTDTEINLVLSHMNSERDRLLFILGIKTGFRISELLSITVKAAQEALKVESLTVQRKSMKGKQRSRTVPLHREALCSLNDYVRLLHGSNELLFPFSRIQAYRIIRDAAVKSGLTGVISTHSMRKSFGQNVYKRTNNIVAAQRALGHASLASTTHYLSVGQDEVNAAILA